MINLPVVEGRSCDGCTKCCEGYLTGEIDSKPFGHGSDCFLVQIGKGCGDYENRPEMPCKTFQCQWLVDENVPERFKPSEINVIISKRSLGGDEDFIELVEAGSKLDSEVLSWALENAIENDKNLFWTIGDQDFWIGDENFNKEITEFSYKNDLNTEAVDYFPPKFDAFQEYKFNFDFEDDSETD